MRFKTNQTSIARAIAVLLLLFLFINVQGQNYFYAVFPGDTIQLSVSIASGEVTQWQSTKDTTLTWQAIDNSANTTITIFSEESSTGFNYYRAKIHDLAVCQADFYSDIIKHRIISTTSDVQLTDWFAGGFVFHVDGNGNGLIAAPSDQGSTQWGCSGIDITGADGTTIGTGKQNTIDILNECSTVGVGVYLCDTLSLNGYTDWFLPSIHELDSMYSVLYQNNIGNFETSYMSSSEISENGFWVMGFHYGSNSTGNKWNTFRVRAARAFNQNQQLLSIVLDSIANINPVSAKAYATITNEDNREILEKGICWSVESNPTIQSNKAVNEEDTLSFNETVVLLEATTTYYLKAYLRTANDTIYSEEELFSTTADFPNCGTVTDIDGNEYQTVTIGDQCWMSENLRTIKYQNGEEIPNITDGNTWNSITSGARSYFNNDSISYSKTYGALYNWYTINNSSSVCPIGWHVPSDEDWLILTNFLGGNDIAGGKMREIGNMHWINNQGATNVSGFDGLPGGIRNSDVYIYLGSAAFWWSSSVPDDFNGRAGQMDNFNIWFSINNSGRNNGHSIRCVQNQEIPSNPIITLDSITNINPVSAKAYATITNEDNREILEKGICWSVESNPTIQSNKAVNEEDTLSFNETAVLLEATTTYYLKAYLRTANDTIYSEEESFTTTADFPNCGTVTDIDGNEYQTVIIGEQCWMRENLKVTHYPNGDTIPYDNSNMDDKYCYYNNDINIGDIYGALYTYGAASGDYWLKDIAINQGICPDGWHLPSSSEWDVLVGSLGEDAGSKMAGNEELWSDHTIDQNIYFGTSGFTALPSGRAYNTNGLSYGCSWWSNTENNNNSNNSYELNYFYTTVSSGNYSHGVGISVRCIKNEQNLTPVSVMIDSVTGLNPVSAKANVTITNEDNIEILEKGICWNTQSNPTILSDKGINEDDTLIFNETAVLLEATTIYYLKAYLRTASDTIYSEEESFTTKADFPNCGTVTDIDGNEYQTVIIGDQCWMRENLKVTHYSDGQIIQKIEDSVLWINTTTPAYCWYNNDSILNFDDHGALYNWYAANQVNVCPSGWHAPSNDEWTELVDYMGGIDNAGGALKNTNIEFWTEPNTGATNVSGFTFLASGIRGSNARFGWKKAYGTAWASDQRQNSAGWYRQVDYNSNSVTVWTFRPKSQGQSIRCIKND